VRSAVIGRLGLFIPAIGAGAPYKSEIKTGTGECCSADPYGFASSCARRTARSWPIDGRLGRQRGWSACARSRWQAISIYEVHPGSWKRIVEGDLSQLRAACCS
jgi:1,4-alpha-glucan branching enzyme